MATEFPEANFWTDGSVCPGCLRPVENPSLHFCSHCGAPVDPVAVLDPIHAIRSEGNMFRRGADRPTGLIVFGMWLLLLPTLLASLVFVASWASTLNALLWLLLGVALPGAILHRVTRNYLYRKNRSEKVTDF